MSFLATQLIGFGAGGEEPFSPFSTEYTTVQDTTVAKPSGATQVIIECIGGGGRGDQNKTNGGGGGGAYAKTTVALDGTYTGIYIRVPTGTSGNSAFGKKNDVSGTNLCLATGGNAGSDNSAGGTAASSTGDVKFSGGNGQGGYPSGGGGAGGPSGAGSNASSATGGAGGGSPAGAGGNADVVGNVYGGGGGFSGTTRAGGIGYVKLAWS